MIMLRSKFSLTTYYLPLVLIFCLLFFVDYIILIKPGHSSHSFVMKMLGIIIIVLINIYFFWIFFLKIPRLKLNKDGIQFSTLFQTNYVIWKDVFHFNIIDDNPFPGMLFSQLSFGENISLETRHKHLHYIFTNVYQNINEIRLFAHIAFTLTHQDKADQIEHEFEKGLSNIKERNKLKPDENQIAQSLRPFLFKSFYGIMIIGLPLLPFMSSKVNFNQGLMFSIVMLIWGIILFGPQLYFFEVSDNVLIVKHQIFFWYKKVFKIEDCMICKISSNPSQSNYLYFIDKDYQSFTYYSAGTSKKNWIKIREIFENKKVDVAFMI